MKFFLSLAFIASFIANIITTPACFAKDVTSGIEYISPQSKSALNNIWTSIIFRLSSPPQNINDISLGLSGDIFGNYAYNIKIADDGRTVIIQHDSAFRFLEHVTLTIPAIQLTSGKMSQPYTLDFTVQKTHSNGSGIGRDFTEFPSNNTMDRTFSNNITNDFAPLPADFPTITVTTNNDPTPGAIFMSNFSIAGGPSPYKNYLMILNNNGYPYYYKKLDLYGADFKILPNGNFIYYELNRCFFEMDNNFNVIDSFSTANGYITDIHDFRMMPDGSYYMVSYDPENINMREYVTDGNENALVTGGIIQKFDAHRNLIFQWRTWDGFEVTDATHEILQAAAIDYSHINAIEVCPDGNILISSRHMDEITKINTQTGEIMWRLGGINSQFTFINDDEKFSHQHAVRMLPNGNITLFDNGNFHTPPHSRAVEYKLDEINKTAELVWQYRNSPDNFGFALGYVQRLSNGNTLIGWGASNPSVTEVKSDGTKVFEMTLPAGESSYRAYKLDWNRYVTTAQPVDYTLQQNFPNPFNPSTKIRFDLPNAGHAKLFVTDVLGKQVAVLVDENLLTGTYEYTFAAGNLSSGAYFYTLVAGGRIETKRMLLVK